jgi:hypothetical protein
MAKITNICSAGSQIFGLDDEGELWALEYAGGSSYWKLVVKNIYEGPVKKAATPELLNEDT